MGEKCVVATLGTLRKEDANVSEKATKQQTLKINE